MSVIKKEPLNTQRPNVVPVPQHPGGMFDVTAPNSPPCPKCSGPARLLVFYSGHVQHKRTRCDRCGDTPLTESGQLVNVGVGFKVAEIADSAVVLETARGPCRRCGCKRVGKFCAGCGIQDGDLIERRRRPRKRACWWRRHLWEYLKLGSVVHRACVRCGAVQEQPSYTIRWFNVPGERARAKPNVAPAQQNPYVEPGVWVG